jgi:hypothetical protein
VLLGAVLVAAQTLAQETDEVADEPIEEITVVGEKTLLNLKFAAIRAENEFFELFNELNTDDQYDVFCDKEGSVRSRIKRRRCWSPFEREIEQDAVREMVGADGRLGSGTRMVVPRNEALIQAKRKKQAEMLRQMVLENPGLQRLYNRFGQANIEFYAERERRCSDNLLCRDTEEDRRPESEE